MNSYIKLINYTEITIQRGTLLRCLAEYPYEEVVDFLVCEPSYKNKGCRLMVASGYKAGIVLCDLPFESHTIGQSYGINTCWLQNNWNKWVYLDCSVEQVLLIENGSPIYPVI
jgi:Immunity protein 45